MPRMQPTNWPMISGRSGLPKFRLSVMASGVAARPLDGIAKDDVVVLLPHPALRAEIGRTDQFLQRVGGAHRRRHAVRVDRLRLARIDERPLVFRRLIAEF